MKSLALIAILIVICALCGWSRIVDENQSKIHDANLKLEKSKVARTAERQAFTLALLFRGKYEKKEAIDPSQIFDWIELNTTVYTFELDTAGHWVKAIARDTLAVELEDRAIWVRYSETYPSLFRPL